MNLKIAEGSREGTPPGQEFRRPGQRLVRGSKQYGRIPERCSSCMHGGARRPTRCRCTSMHGLVARHCGADVMCLPSPSCGAGLCLAVHALWDHGEIPSSCCRRHSLAGSAGTGVVHTGRCRMALCLPTREQQGGPTRQTQLSYKSIHPLLCHATAGCPGTAVHNRDQRGPERSVPRQRVCAQKLQQCADGCRHIVPGLCCSMDGGLGLR